MKITELLNVVAPSAASCCHDGDRQDTAAAPQKKMDMKSLDLFTQQRQRHTLPRVQDLSMNRIIQELKSKDKETAPLSVPQPLLQHTQTPTAARKAAEAKDEEEEPQVPGSTAKKPKRRARNGFAPLTESEKRVKQRQLVKRSYYRKIDTIKELRDVADKLEEEYQAVLDGRRRFAMQHQLHDVTSSSFETLREQYTQLAISKDDLRQENEKLRALAAEQSKARTRVGILLDEELRDQEQVAKIAGLPSLSSSPSPIDTEHPANNEDPVTPAVRIKPVTEDECMTVVRDAYARIMAFRETQSYVTTGASVFGWRDRRKVEGDTMKFFLEKTFPLSAEQVSMTMWGILSTEAGVNRIYNSEISIRFHLVQRVNDSNVIFYRTIERDGQDVTIKSLLLASRVQIDTGYMVLFNSIDPTNRILTPSSQDNKTAVQSPFTRQRREVWANVFSWGLYEHAGENGALCRNSFGGFVPSSSATTLEFWLMHILLIAVRCENEVIGPVFKLQ